MDFLNLSWLLRFTFVWLLFVWLAQRPQTLIKICRESNANRERERPYHWNVDLQQSWKWFFFSWIRNMIECTHKTNAKKSHTKATRWTNIPKMNAIRLNYQCRDTLKFRIKVKTGNLIWQHLYISYRIENVYAFAHIFFSSCCFSSRFFDILHFCYYLILISQLCICCRFENHCINNFFVHHII